MALEFTGKLTNSVMNLQLVKLLQNLESKIERFKTDSVILSFKNGHSINPPSIFNLTQKPRVLMLTGQSNNIILRYSYDDSTNDSIDIIGMIANENRAIQRANENIRVCYFTIE